MDCAHAKEEFSALLDGELTPESRAAIETHLSECSDCLRELDGLKKVDVHYRQLAPLTAPDELEGRIRAATQRSVRIFPGRRIAPRSLWPALAFAASLAIVAGGVTWMLHTPGAQRFEMAKSISALRNAPQASTQPITMGPVPQEEAARKAEPPQRDATVSESTGPAAARRVSPEKPYSKPVPVEPLARAEKAGPERTEGARELAVAAPAQSAPPAASNAAAVKVDRSFRGSTTSAPEAPAAAPPAPPREHSDSPATPTNGVGGSAPRANQDSAADRNELAYLGAPKGATAQGEDKPVAELGRKELAAPLPESPPATAATPPPPAKNATPEHTEKAKESAAFGTDSEEQGRMASRMAPPGAAAKTETTSASPAAPAPAPVVRGASPSMMAKASPVAPAPASVGKDALPKEEAPPTTLAPDRSSPKTAAGRSFTLRDGVWTQDGFKPDATPPPAIVRRGSTSLERLVKKYPELSAVLDVGDRVIARFGNRWYRFEPTETPRH